MALSAFADPSRSPADAELAEALGEAWPRWCAVRARVAAAVPAIEEVWGFTAKSTGWGLRLREDDRVLAYLTPQRGAFLASFVLGEAAVRAARARVHPERLVTIEEARRYAEGRGVRWTVATDDDADDVLAVLACKR